jgi:hypothetical protein
VAERRSGNGDDRDDELDDERGEPSPLGAAATLPVESAARRGKGNGGPPKDGSRRRRRRFGPIGALVAVVVIVVALAFVPAFASGLEKTPRDKIGISYGDGPIEGAHYQRIVQPGSGLFFNGLYDRLYLYPADQRNYIVSKQRGVGASAGVDSVVAPTRDRVQLDYQVAVYYKLNTDLLRQFHEEFGLKYQAYKTDGWNRLIQDTFRQQIENALQEETRRYDVGQVYGNAELLVELQERLQNTLSQRLVEAMGGRYFCAPTFRPGRECEDPTFVIKKIDIPDQVVKAFVSNQTSEALVKTRQNEVKQRQEEARAIEALAAALQKTGDVYPLIKAIESGKIKFWVLPSDGGGITIQGPDGATSPGTTTPQPDGGNTDGAAGDTGG